MKPLLSVITVVFNNADFISEAIDSVLKTNTKDVQYLIIDGGSTDSTVDIIKSYGDKISKFVSEPDEGLYDAMNKGARLADGQYIAFINADDYYVDGELGKVIDELHKKQPDVLYADLDYIDNERKVKRCWRPGQFRIKKLISLWIPPHPTVFMKRDIFNAVGGFDLKYRLAADYDLILRVLSIAESVDYLNSVLVKMRLGGASNVSWTNIVRQNIEIVMSYKSVYKTYPIRQLAFKIGNRFIQIFRAKEFF